MYDVNPMGASLPTTRGVVEVASIAGASSPRTPCLRLVDPTYAASYALTVHHVLPGEGHPAPSGSVSRYGRKSA
jgi:hypothetical protein